MVLLQFMRITTMSIFKKEYLLRPGRDRNGSSQHSIGAIFVRGERIMFFLGEIHPWIVPPQDLWLERGCWLKHCERCGYGCLAAEASEGGMNGVLLPFSSWGRTTYCERFPAVCLRPLDCIADGELW